ncbi:hypothetical protein DXG01_007026 [Tephrocybe rancida]|nr:hypothetical protein DXG01_007026 [Tephrocybe rancida]
MAEVFIFKNAGYENRVLDLSRTDNKTVLGWEENGGGNQKWRLQKHPNNTFIFQDLDGNYLGEDIGRDRPVGVADSIVAVGFRVESAGRDLFKIAVFSHNLVFDLGEDKIVRLRPANGSQTQLWKRERVQ